MMNGSAVFVRSQFDDDDDDDDDDDQCLCNPLWV